jgi:hypothetical protein
LNLALWILIFSIFSLVFSVWSSLLFTWIHWLLFNKLSRIIYYNNIQGICKNINIHGTRNYAIVSFIF